MCTVTLVDTNRAQIVNSNDMYILVTHEPDRCQERWCVIHNPSDHPYRDWDLVWDDGIMWRINPNASKDDPRDEKEVIDPDELFYQTEVLGNRLNRATCPECNDTITSWSQHDFRTCTCGASSVDGGFLYRRWLGAIVGTLND